MRNRFICTAGAAVASLAFASTSVHAGFDACDADLDGSGLVGFEDLVSLLSAWGPCPGCPQDFNDDDDVGFFDLTALLSAFGTNCSAFVATDIAGEPRSEYPHFSHVRAFNVNQPISVALDPNQFAGVTGSCDVYITADKTAGQWNSDPSLTDVSGSPQTVTFSGPDIQDHVTTLSSFPPGDLGGKSLGVGYDLVLDFNQDGTLNDGDYIDGYSGGPGFTVVRKFASGGPHAVSSDTYTGGSQLQQCAYWPTDIGSMGELPLIIMSHGNGHQYTWYDYLGNHMASYGYIFMSHFNNTGPGIETASTTTLTNTDYFLENLPSIGGGTMVGHVDVNQIAWLGHSRGGEGIVRAHDRLQAGTVPGGCCSYTADQITLLSSISPTDFGAVGFAVKTFPDETDYNMIYGSSDGDVSGSPGLACCQPFRLFERATGNRSMSYVQGADHNDFNCCGFNDFSGPASTQIGRPEAQAVAKAMYRALIAYRWEGDSAAKDYMTRQFEDIKAVGIQDTTIVDREFLDDESVGNFMIDNFTTGTSLSVSSSGGSVSGDVTNRIEGRMDDANTSLSWTTSDPMNGMTRAEPADALVRCTVFDWNADSFLEFEIIASERDVTDRAFLSFRACQGTRHPNTISALQDLTFDVTLDDGGTTSTINIGAYEGGIEEPYQRTGSGSGTGWNNEFEVIRMRLTDFLTNGSGLDLTNVEAIRFEFGTSHGDPNGRLGLDEIQLTND